MTRAAIDTGALAKLKDMIGGDVADLAELVSDFTSDLPAQLSAMRAAAARGDWAALRISVHSCKSNARDLGAMALSDLCAALERECKAGAPAALDGKLSAIEAEAGAARQGLADLDLTRV